MEDIRIRYVIQHPETKKIAMMDFSLEQIEDNDIDWIFDSFEHKFCCGGWCEQPCGNKYDNYEIISRDLSTGLRDKNGQEIFVGDILEEIMYVIFNDGSFKTTYKGDHQNGSSLNKTRCRYIKIIGNIYENSELLED